MANTLSFQQSATILNGLMAQLQGTANATVVDTDSFVSVANTALMTGIDPLAMGISQVLDRTIFSQRPYTAKFKAMEKSSAEYGAWTRKINYCDDPFVQDDGYPLTDGTSIDQYVIRKPKTIQLNFYGQNIVEDFITRSEEQLKVAFRGPDEFGEFFAGALTNLSAKHEQKTEAIARANLVNAITALNQGGNTEQVVHLLTEYNSETGQSLTATTVFAPANFEPFMKWAYARIQLARDMMTERSVLYHMNITSPSAKYINRHTPYNKQVLYMYAPIIREMQARVLSAAFNQDRLEYKSIEIVNFWQDIAEPTKVVGKPVYMGADGSVYMKQTTPGTTDTETVTDVVFALLCDDEFMGYRRYSEGMYATPLNARGRYTNFWYHWRWQNWMDFTENAVLFLLD